ncbi:MAG TPA: YezD family protein [Vicinamibacteria bacterium]|nr:YezD family protein [Vicinamibacteria bacterium]
MKWAAQMSTRSIDQTDRAAAEIAAPWLQALQRAVGGLRYGSVELLVHDGRVVQIERREKVRFEPTVSRRPDSPE